MPCTGSTSIFGILRAALRKLGSTSVPSIISAFARPSLSNCLASALVFASFTDAFSITMMPPSLAFEDSACLSARARTFFGRSMAWLRTSGPKARPPPRNCGTRAEPWRAPPVPFWAYIFLPVRQISARPLVLWVPRWRLASCQLMQRWMMSVRGSRPKIASGNLTEPASLPSRVVIFISISRALLRWSGGLRRGRLGWLLLGLRRGLRFRLGFSLSAFTDAEFSRLRRFLRQFLLHRVTHRHPAALGAGNRALDKQKATFHIGLHDLEIERRYAIDTQVTRHLLVLECLARVLTPTSTADRAVRNRHAVRGAQAGEIPTLHAAGKALADGNAADIDELARDEVIGGDLGADRNNGIFGHTEFGELALRLDFLLAEIAAVGLAHVVGAARARTELQRHIAILVLGPVGDHLTLREAQHRDRHVLAGFGEHPGHSDLLSNYTRTHC